MRAVAFVLSVSLLIPTSLLAQVQPVVQPGTRVRITAPDAGLKKRSGTCVALTNGVMDFTPDGEPNASQLDLSSVSKIEVSTGRKAFGAAKGALIGVLLGAGVGAIMQQAICVDSWADACNNEYVYVFAALGGVMAAWGAAKKTERWEEVPLDRFRVGIAPQRHGRWGIGLSVAF